MITPEMLEEIRDEVTDRIAFLEEQAAAHVADDDLVPVIEAVEMLAALSRFVSGANRGLRTRLAEALPQRVNRVGPYEVECNYSKNRSKWQHDVLFREIVSHTLGVDGVGVAGMHLMNVETGEVLGVTADDVAEAIASELKSVLGIDYYRVKEMQKRFGAAFNIDRYCESKSADPSVTIRPAPIAA